VRIVVRTSSRPNWSSALSGADAVIIDLEDAVAPANKEAARSAIRTDFTDLPVFLRINPLGTPWHEADLAAAEALSLAGIMLPKVEATAAFTQLSTRHRMIALVESARGIADARLLAAHPRVARLAFGSFDYCADIGCAHHRDALLGARTELVLASRLAERAPPLDGVTAALDDPTIAEDDARYDQSLGFGGKLCVHPSQIAAVLRGMRPTETDIAWAQRIVAAEGGASSVGGLMVDEPVKCRARGILARAGLVASYEVPQP